MENLIKMDDLGVPLFFGNTHMWVPFPPTAAGGTLGEAFRQIQQAFEVLSDAQRRKDYDEDPAERKTWKFAKAKEPEMQGG